jgi:uncharacterized protein
MRFLIAGASGFIGTYLTRFLEEQGHEVVRLVRKTVAGPGEVAWDPDHGRLDRAAFYGGIDIVVTLAGADIAAQRWDHAYKHLITVSRTRTTGLLAQALAELPSPPRAFVAWSAIGYYGHRPPEEDLTEDSPAGDGFMAEVVQRWEAAADPARQAGVRVLHPRCGIVLGAGGALERMLPPFKLGVGGRLGSGKQAFSWIALDDIGPALLHSLGHKLEGPINFTAPNPVTNAELGQALGHALGKPTLTAVPGFALKAMVGELADELLHGQRVLPAKLLASGLEFSYPQLEPAVAQYVREL